ncbi:hypothetical protein DPX16_14203 [Anabarilius grahami]|uniref:Ig-like domain-containing protein n=1 Tax=Anabarilius grahami TaxID=495550 RepID=A0A3N0XGV5_ANAGA|nr:hypothetical protein DPX16_14203 [Anabarilius grahami]
MRAAVCKTLTSVSYSQSLTEMERSRLALVALMCVLLFSQNRISGAEVEMKVRPGDNITLYCDRSLTLGSRFVWIRNCSHENQPSLEIDFTKWGHEILQRFSSVHNRSSNSYDLHITNISVSDLGLYYCAEVENKVNYENGIISSSKVYYYGNRTTRLSFADSEQIAEILTANVIKVSILLLVLRKMYLLLLVFFKIFHAKDNSLVYFLCISYQFQGDPTEKHQCEKSKTGKICLHTEVSYRLLTSEHPYAKM